MQISNNQEVHVHVHVSQLGTLFTGDQVHHHYGNTSGKNDKAEQKEGVEYEEGRGSTNESEKESASSSESETSEDIEDAARQ